MATYDNAYSRLVGWLKILLPLAALGLLSSMFLISGGPRGDDAIPFAEIEELAREQRISQPAFSGVADDGSVVSVQARSARPEGGGALSVEGLSARLDATDGSHVTLAAGSGAILNGGREARLDGLVRMGTSTGYEIETMGLTAALDTGRVESLGEIAARAPFGEITAGGLTVEPGPDETQGTRLLFHSGVRLVYEPQEEERQP